MKPILSLLLFLHLVMLPGASRATGDLTFSLSQPSVPPGQEAFLRVDDSTGCFHLDEIQTGRMGDRITVTFYASDFAQTPCPPNMVTPLHVSLGTLPVGSYVVEAEVCALLTPPPLDPCRIAASFALGVGVAAPPQPSRIPAVGIVALLLSCSGILALGLTGLRAGPRR